MVDSRSIAGQELRVLVIDDDQLMAKAIARVVTRQGLQAKSVFTLQEGLNEARTNEYDIIFLDVHLPDGDGLASISEFRATRTAPLVIIVTGLGDPDSAELAIRSGAWDYIQKSSSIDQMTLPLVRAAHFREERKARRSRIALKRDGIVGSSRELDVCLDAIAQAASGDASVLITGETGTGKELFALAIHENSSRASGNFVVVDCAALPETLVETTLFGYEKGAYTGAVSAHDGLIRQADGGTLFLDEIGELPLSIQKAFLRVLQERRYRHVGGAREIQSDFRVVAATNRDLDELVAQGSFRKDLLFRLQSFQFELPPLRNRKSDIRELALYYIHRLCQNYGLPAKGFAPEFLQALMTYDWPGNVRELINALERALTAAGEDSILYPQHLPVAIRVQSARAAVFPLNAPSLPPAIQKPNLPQPLGKMKEFRDAALAEAEESYLRRLLVTAGGNIAEASRISDVSQPRLYALIRKYGLQSGRKGTKPE